MSRLVPYPVVSTLLLVMWLLLNDAWSPGTLLGGAIVAIGATLPLKLLDAEPIRIGRPATVLRLVGTVVYDIVRSNIAVATIILGRRKQRTAGFLWIPLKLQHPYGLGVLAIIVTSTPGTLWVQYDPIRQRLLLHVLDLVDEDQWRSLIQGRYERLLLEIFE